MSAELRFTIVNPRHVRNLAKATGQLAKTDRMDALILARYAEAVRPAVRALPDEATQELKAFTARRRQIIEMMVAEKNRLGSAPKTVKNVLTSIFAGSKRNWLAPIRS